MFKIGVRGTVVAAIGLAAVLLAGCTTPLTLENGWQNAPFGNANAEFANAKGIVSFKGAISTAGTNTLAFTLPEKVRPATDVYVHVNLCNANNGRLVIQPSGQVLVQAETLFSHAQCFTSLDGASFAKNASGFSALTLANGWTGAPFGTSDPAVRLDGNIVHFKGAMRTAASNPIAFVLPAPFRPATDVYVPVDLCNATKGRLYIQPSGNVSVQAAGGTFSNAQCFTSLDGATFAVNGTGFTNLSLENGWATMPFGTSTAAARNDAGIVRFKGAVANGTLDVITTLPADLRPKSPVWITADLCNATPGRLIILADGRVRVQARDLFTDAQCFTSLDGVWFALNP